MTIFGGEYFITHPSRVLGKLTTHNPNTGKRLTNQFGKEVTEVWGTLEDVINSINTPRVKRYQHFIANHIVNFEKVGVDKVRRIIEKTKAEAKQRALSVGKDQLQNLKDSIQRYNTDVEYLDYSTDRKGEKKHYTISEEEIKVWVTYQVQKGLYNKTVITNNEWGDYLVSGVTKKHWQAWQAKGLVGFDGKEYVPAPIFYSGNVYDKIRLLKERKAVIVDEIGQKAYDEQLGAMEKSKPLTLLITEDETRKLYLSPFHPIWEEIKIESLASGESVSNKSIGRIFKDHYLADLSVVDFKEGNKTTTAFEIFSYYIQKSNFPRLQYSNSEKQAIKRNATIIGSKLFDRFLNEALTRETKVQIAALWNSKFNFYKPIDYHKIPVGFKVSKYFKGGQLAMRPAQREGVAFMNSRGTGIVAYDVGVGKTMTAIVGIADGFEKGMFKRPLIVVPQKVYKKWIAEINGVVATKNIKKNGKLVHKKGTVIAEGILPHVVVNDYDNLGVKFIDRAIDESGNTYRVAERSITMVTFEGLMKIGFSEESEQGLLKELGAILSQGESGRSKAIVDEQAEGWLDKALSQTELNIEDMGIDCIIVDEVHNFRRLFMEAKGDVNEKGKREAKHFQAGGGGTPSTRAVKLFMLNKYIQNKYQDRNTFGLSATPFTNRATEVYSMLQMYDSGGLREFNVYNLAQFCVNYIDETPEDSYTAKGKFEIKAVIRGYNNLPSLQSIVFRSINYKTGEVANILRPEKIVMPLYKDEKGIDLSIDYVADTRLEASKLQNYWLDQINDFINYKIDEETGVHTSRFFQYYDIPPKLQKVEGDTLIALNAARVVTFSPYALSMRSSPLFSPLEIDYKKFVEDSPKVKYTLDCIKTIKKYHEQQQSDVSGQVIYSDRGKEWFEHIKMYLVKEIGYTAEEVAIFHGDVSKARREKIKNDYQAGDIKIIIGSSTLREGVDLQNHSSCIYLLYLDWNPTDLHQLFGRIWRFGNKHSHVRIVIPLIQGSSDIFTYQKLGEKMDRLNSIWTRSDNTKMFSETEVSPEELKQSLIKDPAILASWERKEKISAVKSGLMVDEANKTALESADIQKSKLLTLKSELLEIAESAKTNPVGVAPKGKEKLAEMEYDEKDIKSVYRICRKYAAFADWYLARDIRRSVEEHIRMTKQMARVKRDILDAKGLTIDDEFSPLIQELARNISAAKEKIEHFKSKEFFAAILARVKKEKAEAEKNKKPITERVQEFARLNYLLNCFQGVHTCDVFGRVVENKPKQAKKNKGISGKEQINLLIEALHISLDFIEEKEAVKELIEALEISLEFV